MKKSCEFCRFAHVSRNQFEVRLDDGTVVTKTGGMKYVCERPGGVKSLSFNTETGDYSWAPLRCSCCLSISA